MPVEVRRTVCNRDCPDTCAIMATVENGRVTALAGDKMHPVTRGFLCYRTRHFLTRQYSPERLTTPLLRRGDDFVPLGWEAALDLAAERLLRIRSESGPAAIFHYRSGGSLGLLKHVCDYFFERFGPVTMKRGDICSGAGDYAQETDFGHEDASDIFDLYNAKTIILWGKNPHVSSPHLLPILREARARSAELVLIDPVHQRSAGLCHAYHQIAPGGDLALAMAITRILFDGELIDPNASRLCDHLDALADLCRRHSVEEWCRQADLAPAVAEDLARRFTRAKPVTALVGWGMGRRVNGASIVRAIDALVTISGNLGVPGGGASFYFARRRAFDTSFVRGLAAAPRSVCEPLFGREVLSLRDPPVRAVWVTAGNPVAMLPESETSAEALRTRDFVVVVDAFLTDTARQAHLVLPTTTLLEAEDLLGSYGHHYLGAARPVVPPPAGVRTDLEIMQGLAERVGLADALAGSPRDWQERLMAKLRPAGIAVAQLATEAVRNPFVPRVLFEGGRDLKTPSRKVNLLHELPAAPTPPSAEYPLWLMALSTPDAQSSQWVQPAEGPAVVTLHPDAAPGLHEGSLARLVSRIGSLVVRVHFDAYQRSDVALMPKGGHLHAGRCANTLVRARTTDFGEGGALYDEHVRLEQVG